MIDYSVQLADLGYVVNVKVVKYPAVGNYFNKGHATIIITIIITVLLSLNINNRLIFIVELLQSLVVIYPCSP